MLGQRRILWMLLLMAAAIALNLLFTRWGQDLALPPVFTIMLGPSFSDGLGQPVRSGLFAAGFLEFMPWAALLLGVLLPLALIGLTTYVLVRPVRAAG